MFSQSELALPHFSKLCLFDWREQVVNKLVTLIHSCYLFFPNHFFLYSRTLSWLYHPVLSVPICKVQTRSYTVHCPSIVSNQKENNVPRHIHCQHNQSNSPPGPGLLLCFFLFYIENFFFNLLGRAVCTSQSHLATTATLSMFK